MGKKSQNIVLNPLDIDRIARIPLTCPRSACPLWKLSEDIRFDLLHLNCNGSVLKSIWLELILAMTHVLFPNNCQHEEILLIINLAYKIHQIKPVSSEYIYLIIQIVFHLGHYIACSSSSAQLAKLLMGLNNSKLFILTIFCISYNIVFFVNYN